MNINFKFIRDDIFKLNNDLKVYINRRNSMINSSILDKELSWGFNSVNLLANGTHLILIDKEFADDTQNEQMLKRIFDKAFERNVKSIAINGVRDISQIESKMSDEERIASQNLRCLRTIQITADILKTTENEISEVVFCSASKDYFGNLFKDFTI